MDITKKSISMLIEELITESLRCWFAQDKVMGGGSDKEIAEAAVLAQQTNAKRKQLMRAIDEILGDNTRSTPLKKSYE